MATYTVGVEVLARRETLVVEAEEPQEAISQAEGLVKARLDEGERISGAETRNPPDGERWTVTVDVLDHTELVDVEGDDPYHAIRRAIAQVKASGVDVAEAAIHVKA